jgi:tRNA (guanine-N7-)-methyltransferase
MGALFDPSVPEVWLEIGFGGGEHLLAMAERHPHIGFVGCEPFINGAVKLLSAIEQRQIRNIRIHDGDAVDLIRLLPENSVDRIYLLYPDPWPKRRHNKRRFVSAERLASLARILKPGGMFRFASDIDDYVGWTQALTRQTGSFRWVAARADDWRLPWDGWVRTRYEQKAIREGRIPSYLTFERV